MKLSKCEEKAENTEHTEITEQTEKSRQETVVGREVLRVRGLVARKTTDSCLPPTLVRSLPLFPSVPYSLCCQHYFRLTKIYADPSSCDGEIDSPFAKAVTTMAGCATLAIIYGFCERFSSICRIIISRQITPR